LLLAAASTLAPSAAAGADTIRDWTTEEQPERLARQEAIAADVTAESGIEVEVIRATEPDLGTGATATFAAGELPDVICHPLQYALLWVEAGILDTDAASDVIDEIVGGLDVAQRWAGPKASWCWHAASSAV